MVRAVDKRDVSIRAFQRFSGRHATEARANNDDLFSGA